MGIRRNIEFGTGLKAYSLAGAPINRNSRLDPDRRIHSDSVDPMPLGARYSIK
jgi:hypothetical protein